MDSRSVNYSITVNNSHDYSNLSVPEDISSKTIVCLSLLFFMIGVVGICGNLLVIFAVVSNKKMRTSMTNLLITNLAMADFLIMVFGIPEIIQFMMNKGWILDDIFCKVNRFILVSSLYGSVLTLIALCVERFVAIVHPIKAHIYCNKKRLVIVLGCVWSVSLMAGLPTVLFNDVFKGHPDIATEYCMIKFPDDHNSYYKVFKFTESVLFYIIPLVIQLVLYVLISKQLFIGSERLHTRISMREVNGVTSVRHSDALQARKGVVKMLMLCVIVYILSYLPNQVFLIWNIVAPQSFHETWSYIVFVNIVAYINSAANPILYSIFSQNFRQRFKDMLCPTCYRKPLTETRRVPQLNSNTYPSRIWRHTSLASATTDV